MWRGLKKGLQSVDPMVDSWGRQWVDKMGLGLATEIDVEEALDLFFFIRVVAILVLGLTLIFIVGAILFTLKLGEKANYSLLRAKYDL